MGQLTRYGDIAAAQNGKDPKSAVYTQNAPAAVRIEDQRQARESYGQTGQPHASRTVGGARKYKKSYGAVELPYRSDPLQVHLHVVLPVAGGFNVSHR